MLFLRIFRIYQNPANPVYTEIDGWLQDFYFENEIEFLKTGFTKNLFIIFMILENFWEAFQAMLFLDLFRSFRCFPRYRNNIQIFPTFLSPRQTRDSPTWDSAFNAEILSMPPHVAFNAFQINPNQVIMTFVLLLKRSFLLFPGRNFNSRVWPILA